MELDQQTLTKVQYLSMLVGHHKEIVQKLEGDLKALVKEATGTDLEEKPYTLNLETGRLDAAD